MERAIDEFITRGYRLQSEGESSARLKEKDWGDGATHLFVALLTAWWTFGLANAIYAIYAYVTADEVVIKIGTEDGDETDEPASSPSTEPKGSRTARGTDGLSADRDSSGRPGATPDSGDDAEPRTDREAGDDE